MLAHCDSLAYFLLSEFSLSDLQTPVPLSIDDLVEIKETGLWDITALLLGRRIRFRVQGRSMLPLLDPQDLVLVMPGSTVSVGDLIVLRHPFKLDVTLVKYVAFVNEHGSVYVLGVNLQESTDSRTIGWILPKLILGRISSRIRP
ncbi:MAG: S26 family signal peptidase [Myxococcales bacterium]|nr:S26 family signal peptidase [Myxococcales bacterium]